MIRALIVTLILGGGFLLGMYHPHVRAIVNPCQAVRDYCSQGSNTLGNSLRCGADRLAQLFKEPSRVDCMRTWLDLNKIENNTIHAILDRLDNQEDD